MDRNQFVETQQRRFGEEMTALARVSSAKGRTYSRKADWISEELRREHFPGMKVLEIGVGPGILSGLVIQRFPDVTFWGTDAFEGALACARDRLKVFPNVHLTAWDVEKAPPPGLPEFDFIFGCDILHHLLRPWRGLENVFQASGSRAKVCLLETNPLNPYLGIIVGSLPEESRLWHNHPRCFRSWFRKAGWKLTTLAMKPAFLPSGPRGWENMVNRIEDAVFGFPFIRHLAGMYYLVGEK